MPTAAPSLTEEIAKLQNDLAAAERRAIRPEDAAADAIHERLLEKQRELYQQLEAEAASTALQQRSLDFQALAQLERDIDRVKLETVMLRTMIVELPQKLAKQQWELSQLLRQHALLKADLQMKG